MSQSCVCVCLYCALRSVHPALYQMAAFRNQGSKEAGDTKDSTDRSPSFPALSEMGQTRLAIPSRCIRQAATNRSREMEPVPGLFGVLILPSLAHRKPHNLLPCPSRYLQTMYQHESLHTDVFCNLTSANVASQSTGAILKLAQTAEARHRPCTTCSNVDLRLLMHGVSHLDPMIFFFNSSCV